MGGAFSGMLGRNRVRRRRTNNGGSFSSGGGRGRGRGGGGGGGGEHEIPFSLPVKAVYLGYSNLQANTFESTIRNAIDLGYNLLVLAFWIRESTGVDPYSGAYYWSKLPAETQKTLRQYARNHGARITVSIGGSTYGGNADDYPLGGGTAFGTAAANFAMQNNLDGIDLDLENFTSSFGTSTSSALTKPQLIQWMTDATSAVRTNLGPEAIITHAPQSPYFNVEFSHGYVDFYNQLPSGAKINFFLIQYYNQGETYLTYATQMISDADFHPQTAVAELIAQGIPKEMIVVGRTMQPNDGSPNSWISPVTLGQWIQQAARDPAVSNWNTGISAWEWHTNGNPNAQTWIQAIFGT